MDLGFSLLEVLVAIGLLGGGMTALAQLVSLAQYANAGARRVTVAAVLAADKMEALRGAGDAGSGSTGTLDADVDGYCDFFDADGRLLRVGMPRPPGTRFVRRWSTLPLGADSATSVLQVIVTAAGDSPAATSTPWPAARRDVDTELLAMKTRKDR